MLRKFENIIVMFVFIQKVHKIIPFEKIESYEYLWNNLSIVEQGEHILQYWKSQFPSC